MWDRVRQFTGRVRREPRRSRPAVERLEGREVPATIAVTTFADVVNPADGKVSLREAITFANATPARDTILLRPGVYKIAIPHNPANPDPNASGSFDIVKGVTLVGAGPARTVIDAAKRDRAFAVTGSAPGSIDVVFQGLTVRGGEVSGPGGGILMGNANVTLRDCAVRDNRAASVAGTGGGISNGTARGSGGLTLIRTAVTDNVAGDVGGGVYLAGDTRGEGSPLRLQSSQVLRNSSRSGGGIHASRAALAGSAVRGNTATLSGGGLSVYSATLTSSAVSGNAAGGIGGGIDAEVATLVNSTVSNNRAGNYGGGVVGLVRATLIGSTVSGNVSSADGGGVVAETTELTNCTVSGNVASGDGGGVFAGFMRLLNCTVVRNDARNGGGVYHSSPDRAIVTNSIIALNHATRGPAAGYDVFGEFISQGHNLIGDGAGSVGFGVTGDQVGTSQKPLDPKLGALALNGGPTQTHALLAGSSAIDRGNSASAPVTDQRGADRRRDGDRNGSKVVDIGAFER